jgi:hypothetical protein
MNNFYGAIAITVTTLILFYIYLLRNKISSNKKVIVSQSMLLYRYNSLDKKPRRLKTKTQSTIQHDKTNIRVIILDNNAYWIKDNMFYKAPLVNELIDKESAEQVDTMGMDKVQLEKMLFIMDRLREGIGDDSRGPGDK